MFQNGQHLSRAAEHLPRLGQSHLAVSPGTVMSLLNSRRWLETLELPTFLEVRSRRGTRFSRILGLLVLTRGAWMWTPAQEGQSFSLLVVCASSPLCQFSTVQRTVEPVSLCATSPVPLLNRGEKGSERAQACTHTHAHEHTCVHTPPHAHAQSRLMVHLHTPPASRTELESRHPAPCCAHSRHHRLHCVPASTHTFTA